MTAATRCRRYKTFSYVVGEETKEARVFVADYPLQNERHKRDHLNIATLWNALAFPANIILGFKGLKGTKVMADMANLPFSKIS